MLDDVARVAQVHKATASRALNAETRSMVAPQTVQRVLAAAEQLGYRPNLLARGLRRQRSLTIGMMVPDLTDPIYPLMVRSVEETLARDGWTAFVGSTDRDIEKEGRLFEALRSRQVDGFIFAGAHRKDPLIDEASKLGISAVLINGRTDRQIYPWVVCDDESGVEQAVRHLIELGHKHIAHLAGAQDTSSGAVRCAAFLSTIREAGLGELDCPVIRTSGFGIEEGLAAAREVIRDHPEVTAIFAANDMMAVGALTAIREAGMTCPADVSLVGFNDTLLTEHLAPSLTTVNISIAELGSAAAGILLRMLAGERKAESSIYPVSLVVRESSAPPRPGSRI
jgi:LacI family transcriptional regulator